MGPTGRALLVGVLFAVLAIRAAVMPAFTLTPTAVGLGEVASTVVVAVTALLVT